MEAQSITRVKKRCNKDVLKENDLAGFFTPKAFRPLAQGCRVSGYPGDCCASGIQLWKSCDSAQVRPQPRWGWNACQRRYPG